MRYFRIFLLHFQYVLSHRSRSLVWFLIALIGPFVLIIFWQGAFSSSQTQIAGWTQSMMISYYVVLSFVSVTLTSHVEEDVARDIKDGDLASYLTKPFSYYWINFFEELPYRLFQGGCGLVVVIILYILFGRYLSISITPVSLPLVFIIFVFAFLISETFKMIIGLLALWFIDVRGFFEIMEVLKIIAAGYLMPITLLPGWLAQIALLTPFSYMIYFPVVSIVEPLSLIELLKIIFIQMVWLVVMGFIYRFIWKRGVKRFTGVGN